MYQSIFVQKRLLTVHRLQNKILQPKIILIQILDLGSTLLTPCTFKQKPENKVCVPQVVEMSFL